MMMGLLIGVAVAYSTANVFTKSFFDTVLTMKKLPYLPILFSSSIYKLEAYQVCEFEFSNYLKETATIYDLILLINRYDKINLNDQIPVIQNDKTRKLVGSVKLMDMLRYLEKVGDKLEDGIVKDEDYNQSFKIISGNLKNTFEFSKVIFFLF